MMCNELAVSHYLEQNFGCQLEKKKADVDPVTLIFY